MDRPPHHRDADCMEWCTQQVMRRLRRHGFRVLFGVSADLHGIPESERDLRNRAYDICRRAWRQTDGTRQQRANFMQSAPLFTPLTWTRSYRIRALARARYDATWVHRDHRQRIRDADIINDPLDTTIGIPTSNEPTRCKT